MRLYLLVGANGLCRPPAVGRTRLQPSRADLATGRSTSRSVTHSAQSLRRSVLATQRGGLCRRIGRHGPQCSVQPADRGFTRRYQHPQIRNRNPCLHSEGNVQLCVRCTSGLSRSRWQYHSVRGDDADVRTRLRELAAQKPRWGYHQLHELLRRRGRTANHKKVLWLYRDEWRLVGVVARNTWRSRACPCRNPRRVLSAGVWASSATRSRMANRFGASRWSTTLRANVP